MKNQCVATFWSIRPTLEGYQNFYLIRETYFSRPNGLDQLITIIITLVTHVSNKYVFLLKQSK